MKACECNGIIPNNIRKIIIQKGLRYNAVARRVGITNKKLSDMLNGRRIIKAIDIMRISEALEVTPNEIFGTDSNQKSA